MREKGFSLLKFELNMLDMFYKKKRLCMISLATDSDFFCHEKAFAQKYELMILMKSMSIMIAVPKLHFDASDISITFLLFIAGYFLLPSNDNFREVIAISPF